MQQTKYCNVIMKSASGRKINKQIKKLLKQMPRYMKHIILTNMNVKLYS